jgi:hypothetical protein
MKNKFSIAMTLAVIMAMLVTSLAMADVITNQYIYYAGDIVYISGNGMQVDETVTVNVLYPDGSLAQQHEVLADNEGNFFDVYVVPNNAPTGDYIVVTTGQSSGNTFTTTFDPPKPECGLVANISSLSDGATFTASSVGGTASVTLTWSTAISYESTYTTEMDVDGSPISTEANGSQVLALGVGDHHFQLKADAPTNDCQNPNRVDNVTIHVVNPATPPDTTPPTTTIALNPSTPNGNNGWYTADVHVTVSSVDADVAETRCVLDPASAPASFEDIPVGCSYTGAGTDVTTDGLHTIYAASKDTTGNKETPVNKSFKLDKTVPTLSLAFTPDSPDGNNGWWKTLGGVPFAWTCSDATSGIDNSFDSGCPDPTLGTVTSQGTTNFADQVKDMAGNLSVAVNRDLKLDNVAPDVAVTGVSNGATYILGSVPPAGCSTTDLTSGVATYASLSVTGGNVNGVGSFTAACNGAEDNAGNTNSAFVTYSVIYDWHGFFQPIDNNMLNVAKGGSAIPVKFSLSGYQGLNIFATGYPRSIKINCDSNTAEDSIETTVTAGGSSLTYDALADQYVYVWKTEKSWAGTCRQLQVKLSDEMTYTANFKFK